MVREIFVSIYLFIFRLLFIFFNLFPQEKKTIFVTSFGDNVFYVLKEVEKQTTDKIVVLKTPQCKVNFNDSSKRLVLNFKTSNIFHWLLSIYHLATSQKVFIDNYYAFLSVINFKTNVTCTQLWHAAGAIKKFGLEDPSNAYRSNKAIKRFRKVYDQFDYAVVGSEKMANIYRESFGLSSENILRTGIPRTDFFYNKDRLSKVKSKFIDKHPQVMDKKILLYAPTYRDNDLIVSDLPLEINTLYKKLGKDYVLLLRLHPAVKANIDNVFSNFIIDVSDYPSINELLTITNVLITDYSSIPFEFSLLDRPMIFYAYDLDEYSKTRGFWEDYQRMIPGPIVSTTEEIVDVLLRDDFEIDLVRRFSEIWNEYSRGGSSEKLVRTLYHEEEEVKVKVN